MSSISTKSCEINEYKEEQTQIVKEIEDFVSEITSERYTCIEEAEGLITEKCDSWKRRLLEMSLSKKASKQESEPVQCAKCKQVCHPLRKRERHFTTTCGVIRVMRWVYRCDCGHRQVDRSV
jgi:Txe/YoeB family toxin of Txe-Axe toxin-antitoxin module